MVPATNRPTIIFKPSGVQIAELTYEPISFDTLALLDVLHRTAAQTANPIRHFSERLVPVRTAGLTIRPVHPALHGPGPGGPDTDADDRQRQQHKHAADDCVNLVVVHVRRLATARQLRKQGEDGSAQHSDGLLHSYLYEPFPPL